MLFALWIAIIKNNVAKMYMEQNNYPKALELLLESVGDMEEIFGNEHPNTIKVYNNIAEIYRAQDDMCNSLEWYYKMHKSTTVPDDLCLLCEALAILYFNERDYTNALKWQNKVIAIAANASKARYNTIAEIYDKLGDDENAQKYRELAEQL